MRLIPDTAATFNGRFPAFSSSRILRALKRWGSVGLSLVCVSTLLITPGCRDKGKLILALPVADWWTAAPFQIPESAELFKKQSVELTTLEVRSGLESKNAVVAGTADIGISAATPLALAAARKEGLVILGTYLRSSSIVGLVRPSNMAANAVPPAPVGMVASTISESLLYAYLKKQGQEKLLLDKQLQTLPVKPADIPGLFKSQEIKSAVIWEPFLSIAGEHPGMLADRDTPFEVNLYIITRPTVLEERPEAIRAFLNGVEAACRFLRENSNQSRQNMEKKFGFRPDFLAPVWPTVQYQLLNDRQRMEAEIVRESETAKALGRITQIPDLNYLFRQQ